MQTFGRIYVHLKEYPLISSIRTKTKEVQYPNISKEIQLTSLFLRCPICRKQLVYRRKLHTWNKVISKIILRKNARRRISEAQPQRQEIY